MRYFISIILIYYVLLSNGCKDESTPDPFEHKAFDLIITDKITGQNLIGPLFNPSNIQVLDEYGDERANVYYDSDKGYIIGDIYCMLPKSEEFKIILSTTDTDTLRTAYVNGTGSFDFFYNNTFITNVKWDEWGYTRGIDIPILTAEK